MSNKDVNNKEVENKEVENKKVEAKKYKVRIPINPLNPRDTEIIVGVNEKYAKIIRGETTEVEEAVYEVLKNANLV